MRHPSPLEENHEAIIHARPCRTLHCAKPSGHGPDDPQPAKFDGTPGELAAEYYAQRASVGLIVTEGTQPSDDGQGYLATPGIYTPAHVAGWRKVTTAVHDKGGHIFIQIMHAGRMSHPDNTPHHRQAVAPRSRRGHRCSPRQGCRTFPRRAR
jgi:NADH:flavin oxidoreductases, Old Yellow Enzyme family